MNDWLREGTAHRSPVRRDPVRHLLVCDHGSEWALWCSGNKGRLDNNPHSRKFCRECVNLARDAVAEGTLNATDLGDWPVRTAAGAQNMATEDCP